MGWNVLHMEEILRLPLMLVQEQEEDMTERMLNAMTPEEKTAVCSVASELGAILLDSEQNPTKYHINHIHSDVVRYEVRTSCGDEEASKVFDLKFDALRYKEQCEADGMEAELDEFDPHEYWAVIDAGGRNATGMLYPSKLRAMAFLYHIAEPPVFSEKRELLPTFSNALILGLANKEA